jgi:hypothetical protein
MAVTLNASTTSGLEIASDTSGIVTLRNNGTDALSVSSGNLQFNSGYGSVATAYGCRAWVNFNGTGTVAIRASGNVSSITDNGVGNYTINLTTIMPDVNFSTFSNPVLNTTLTAGEQVASQSYAQSTSAVRIVSFNTSSNGANDVNHAYVAIFR